MAGECQLGCLGVPSRNLATEQCGDSSGIMQVVAKRKVPSDANNSKDETDNDFGDTIGSSRSDEV